MDQAKSLKELASDYGRYGYASASDAGWRWDNANSRLVIGSATATGRASISSASYVTSCTLAPVRIAASGTPSASVTT